MPAETRLPTGTVSFLFTDIEGSTRLWEAHPEEMRVALASHDAIFREIVPARRGAIFKTVGDAICAAFERPEDALFAAVDAQRRLATHPWPDAVGEIRVRMGIHTGVAQERDDDYFGRTVNRVARFMSIAHGGQILVSGSTAALLRQADLKDLSLRDLGAHRLKDLAQPESTYQVAGPGLRADFPALSSLDAHPNNLPSQLSSFIGREAELHHLHEALTAHRVVTITGPGGMGKTRLALQVGAELVHEFKDGVWFVELAQLEDAKLVAHSIADVINIHEQPTEAIEITVARAIGKKQLLLILDNSEHLIDLVADLTKQLARNCPLVRFLVTSRQPLHLDGEHVLRLLPLSLQRSGPQAVGTPPASEQLFLDRALAAHPRLELTDEARVTIGQICRRLEGIPLAIELAAARVATLSLDELDRRLLDRFKLLVSRDRSRDARHRTLRSTIDWSYQLLNADEREFVRELSVFDGPFTVGAVEKVTTLAEESLDLLESVVSKSFVALHTSNGHRFVIYDTIRDYLRAGLDPKLTEPVRRRHFEYYRSVVTDAPEQHTVAGQAAWLDAVDCDIADIRNALAWAAQCQPLEASAMLIDLARYWQLRGHIAEGFTTITHLLATLTLPDASRAPLLRRAATFATIRDDYREARRLTSAAREAYENIGDRSGVAEATFNAAVIGQRVGDDDSARKHYAEALAIFREVGHIRGAVLSIMNLSLMAFAHRHLDSAEHLVAEAISLESELEDANMQADISTLRGNLALQHDDFSAALVHYEKASAMKNQIGNRIDAADIYALMAEAHAGLGQSGDAERLALAAVEIGREVGSQQAVIQGLEILAFLCCRAQAYGESARFFDEARELRREYSLHYILGSTKELVEQTNEVLTRQSGRRS
jgi:predicted ATPase/class 3 adenylate cyclase